MSDGKDLELIQMANTYPLYMILENSNIKYNFYLFYAFSLEAFDYIITGSGFGS